MKFASVFGLLVGGLAGLGMSALHPRHFESSDFYVLEIDSTTSPDHVAARLGLRNEGQLGELAGHYVFRAPKTEDDIVRREVGERRKKRSLGDIDVIDAVRFSQKQKLRPPMPKRVIPPPPSGFFPRSQPKRETFPDVKAVQKQKSVMKSLDIKDPIFTEQWHLFNSVQVGHDLNVTDVWLSGTTGKNATVAMIDDGLDMNSKDLKPNYFALGSWDYNDDRPEPIPTLSNDQHGTRCAGEVAAAKNDVCGMGVAYESKVAGIRILSGPISDIHEAEAMNYKMQHNQIYSCSWGPLDDGKSMDAPGILIKKAMVNGVQKGRNGLGSIFVFATGNGAMSEDNCNFDGYTNSIYSISVGALDREGHHPSYSEQCSAQLVVAYSSGGSDSIHTTDVGVDKCTSSHGGTSAAAPLAAGVYALALDLRPDLTWRDIQYLTVDTAVPVELDSGNWQTTTIGKKYSHIFGYGKIDAYAFIEATKNWKVVKPQAWYFTPWLHVKKEIPQGDKGLSVHFEVTQEMLDKANFERLEHVTVTMNVNHTRRGDLSVDLISPSKITSHIATTRKNDDSTEGYNDWTFMSVAHWGESGVGTWTIIIRDTVVNDFNGTFIDWHLKLWGEVKDESKAKLLPMPTEEDDADHDVIPTVTPTAATTSLPPHPAATKTGVSSVATEDVPQRPEKPSKTGVGAVLPTTTQTGAAQSTTASSWLPSFLPTFGVSSRTQAWIYSALGLIVAFCLGLGAWLWWMRRKRLQNNPRDTYEFEPLNPDDATGLGASHEKGAKRRGGELYDAFAGGSEDEDYNDHDHDSLVSSDSEDENSRDTSRERRAS
ncbi:peptidase S8/S53 domain-containing protein [Poronia punctata]|nr:peptidase S8/S53 domain-containing protein [Poronia punctata]